MWLESGIKHPVLGASVPRQVTRDSCEASTRQSSQLPTYTWNVLSIILLRSNIPHPHNFSTLAPKCTKGFNALRSTINSKPINTPPKPFQEHRRISQLRLRHPVCLYRRTLTSRYHKLSQCHPYYLTATRRLSSVTSPRLLTKS